MRKILFSAILCMVSVATFAQKIMGKVVDENGNALQHVSLQVVGKEDLMCTSDAKGLFKLDCDKNEGKKTTLRLSCVGYQTLDIAWVGDGSDMQLGIVKLTRDSYKLGEVTVTAGAKLQVDRTLHFPSEKIKANSNDGFELINKMMLPGVSVNLANKSFSMQNKQTVLIYINDKPAVQSDILGLRPTDVTKVEFVDAPGAEYGFDTNVGCVIKFYVKRQDHGIVMGLQSLNAMTTLYGEHYAYAKYYKGKSEFSLSANNTYTQVHRRSTSEYNEYNLDGEPHVIQRDGINTKLGYTSTAVNLGYNLTNPQKYILDLNISGTFYDAPNRGNKQYITETGKIPYYSFTKNTEHYFRPVFNLFHKVYLSNHQTLTSNAVYTIIDTDYGYYLNEYADNNLEEKLNQYNYDTDGLKHSLILETKFMNQIGEVNWTSGVRYTYGDVENKYKGYSDAIDCMYDNNLYFYSQLSGSIWKKLGYLVGIGASYQNAKQGEQQTENWIFRPRVTLQMPVGKVRFRYVFQIAPIAPSLSNLSATMQQANALEYSQGNPALKMNAYYINQLTASASLGKLYVQNVARYDYSHHPVMEEIRLVKFDGKRAFLHTMANQKSFTHFSDNVNLQYELVPDKLTIQGSVTYHHYQSIAGSYRHFLNSVDGMVQTDMNVGKWSMGASWNSATKELSGETISKFSPSSNVYVNYSFGQFRIGLMANNLFQKNGIKQPEDLINKNLKKSLTLRVPSMGNMVMINLVWNLSKGKSHDIEKNSFSNADGDSGILKF